MTTYIDPRGKLFGHLDRLAQLQAGLRPPPVNVEVDLSNRCNLGCAGCHFAHVHSRGRHAGMPAPGYQPTGDLMDRDLALALPGILKAAGVRSVTWTGGGEPTLYPDLAGVLKATRRAGLDQGIYTNGALLDEETAQTIKRTCQWVYVSLDYADRESYALGKQSDAFDAACAGVKMLTGSGATLGVGFLLGPQNWQYATDMVHLGRELGADYIQFRPMVMVDPETPGVVNEDTGWVRHCLAGIRAAGLDRVEGVIVDASRFEMYAGWRDHGYDACWWCSMQAVITPDGRVWACVNRRGRPAALLGDLGEWEFGTLWNNRPGPEPVGGECRVLCRGHIPNLMLNDILMDRPHGSFI